MPPQKLLDQAKRSKNFINSKGYPRYCTVATLPDGSVVLNGGRSRRGKVRGPPASKDWPTALKGCDDVFFIDFLKKCLEWDPSARLTPSAALRHGWLRRRLPRAPQNNTSNVDVTDSPNRNSNTLVTSSSRHSYSTKLNTIGTTNPSKSIKANLQQMSDEMSAAINNTRTKFPQISNTVT